MFEVLLGKLVIKPSAEIDNLYLFQLFAYGRFNKVDFHYVGFGIKGVPDQLCNRKERSFTACNGFNMIPLDFDPDSF